MSRLADFIKQNKEAVYALAEQNTKRNEEGKVVLAKDDPWRDETEWDDLFDIQRRT